MNNFNQLSEMSNDKGTTNNTNTKAKNVSDVSDVSDISNLSNGSNANKLPESVINKNNEDIDAKNMVLKMLLTLKDDKPELNTTESKELQDKLDEKDMVKYYSVLLAFDLLTDLPRGFSNYERRVKNYLSFEKGTQKSKLLKKLAIVSQRPLIQQWLENITKFDLDTSQNQSSLQPAVQPPLQPAVQPAVPPAVPPAVQPAVQPAVPSAVQSPVQTQVQTQNQQMVQPDVQSDQEVVQPPIEQSDQQQSDQQMVQPIDQMQYQQDQAASQSQINTNNTNENNNDNDDNDDNNDNDDIGFTGGSNIDFKKIKNLSKKLDKEFNVKELRKISKRYGLKIKQKGGKYFKKNEICKNLAKTLRK